MTRPAKWGLPSWRVPVCRSLAIPSVDMPLGAPVLKPMRCYGGVTATISWPGDHPVHGRAPTRRRDRREVGAGLSRRRFWEAMNEGGLATRANGGRTVPKPHVDAGAPGFNALSQSGDMRQLVKDPVAYRYQHNDGLICTMLLLSGLIRDFNFARTLKGGAKPGPRRCISRCRMAAPRWPASSAPGYSMQRICT